MAKEMSVAQVERQRTSIAVEGIDTSTPHDLVADGKCEVLHNLRFHDSAWRPVHMQTILHDVAEAMGEEFLSSHSIIYHHPAAGDNYYIAMAHDEEGYKYYTINLYSSTSTLFATHASLHSSISHFGNVLIINIDSDAKSYVWGDGAYTLWQKPSAPLVELTYGEFSPANINYEAETSLSGAISTADESSTDVEYGLWMIFDEAGNSIYPIAKNDKWWGEVAFFAAYRMQDGSVISPSPIGIIASEKAVESTIPGAVMIWCMVDDGGKLYGIAQWGTGDQSYDADKYVQPQMHYIAPSLSLSIPTSGISELIESVAIFCTRIYSPFRFSTAESVLAPFADTKFPEEPFYLCKEIPISTFNEGKFSVTLSYDLLRDITSKKLYTPVNNIHDYASDVALDYNNRLHLANYTTKLHRPDEILGYLADGTATEVVTHKVAATLDVNNKQHTVMSNQTIDLNQWAIAFKKGFESIISYPDYRCSTLHFWQLTAGEESGNYGNVQLSAAPNNNFAYIMSANQLMGLYFDALHYDPLNIARTPANHFYVAENNTFASTNKIIVSQANNPFAFDFANTYAIGSEDSEIVAIQSAAIELSDTKYGEYPLYAFTTEGIFALQAGENSLYSSVLPINYDKIINTDVLAINYNLVYITKKGVHILNSKGSTVISHPINDYAGKPLPLLADVRLINPKSFNEVVLYHAASKMAYIYNLEYGYWSTRDMEGVVLNDDKIVTDTLIVDASIEDEKTTPKVCLIKSQPIKMGNLEFKRLETIIPRISLLADDATALDFTLQGTNNPRFGAWSLLRCYHTTFNEQGLYPITLRRTPFSSKYSRFFLELHNDEGVGEFTFTNIDYEWYLKFLRKMR